MPTGSPTSVILAVPFNATLPFPLGYNSILPLALTDAILLLFTKILSIVNSAWTPKMLIPVARVTAFVSS